VTEVETNKKDFITSDIGIAAYLQLLGFKVKECKRQESGKFFFRFSDENSECATHSLQFLESDFCRFDNNVRNLKKILFS